MKKQYLKFYLSSIILILLVSIYPIYMAIQTLTDYFANGYVDATNYPKYIIPYAPISIALIIIVTLTPLLYKLFKRWILLFSSLLGSAIFLLCEIGFEQITIVEGYTNKTLPLESWQYSLCIATPEILLSIGEPIYAENNPAYKIHFYLISIIIILAVVNVICGFTRMIYENDYTKKKPLIAQLIAAIIFIGLCILACFTAFYRNGTIHISSLSATLMSIFFILFGVTFGTYVGCIFYRKHKLLSIFLPSLASIMTTFAMYIGELIMMDGKLFRYGQGFIFNPIGYIPFAVIDFIVILISGLTSGILMLLLNRNTEKI